MMFHRRKNNRNQEKDKQNVSNEHNHSVEPLSGTFNEDIQRIRRTFQKSSDVIIRTFNIGNDESNNAAIIFTDGLADSTAIQNFILESLMVDVKKGQISRNKLIQQVKNSILTVGDITEIRDFESLYTTVLSGNTVILINGSTEAISASTAGWEDRAVSEPATQTVVRGPREGFTENLRTNTALLRRKIKDHNLYCEQKQIGTLTKTNIAVMYIKGIVNDKLVGEVHHRLDKIDIEGILESGYIEELIQDETFTPFPTIFNSERPDVIAACLLEGRVAILVDGTPFVLVVPSLFIQNFQVAEDYYQRSDIGSLLRLLRIVCFIIALFGPSFYIAVTTFHQEMLPTPLLISLAAQREGVPFPAFVEAVLMEIAFEILREAGIRMPRAVGQAVSIVGALVLGQAAVEAGIVSASMVIVVSLTAIANFVFPAYNMAISVRMLRFGMMFFAASFGLYGITVGSLALIMHLNSLRSFGVPYMAPFSPLIPNDLKDSLVRFPRWALLSRPRLINRKNMKRQASPAALKPEPDK
ncbi:spore germination protein [Bacillus sp. ISL-18]|uniref:spore germination protein n=1 Tax=Bacillus sp. ISL-18 TaxID=2819118 RepID=UPI001BEC9D9F|nr:spore germination protein [Bacillus sp. ISL-18]MBT2653927.1 spore germination protein [Bacillus sp. ISL-18]